VYCNTSLKFKASILLIWGFRSSRLLHPVARLLNPNIFKIHEESITLPLSIMTQETWINKSHFISYKKKNQIILGSGDQTWKEHCPHIWYNLYYRHHFDWQMSLITLYQLTWYVTPSKISMSNVLFHVTFVPKKNGNVSRTFFKYG
jgi:hypothetical protein